MRGEHALLTGLYEAFNGRDVDAVLALLDPEVQWPNGMEGGWVRGHDAVRAYWTRQWGLIDPVVIPTAMTLRADGAIAVDVHQIVRDLAGKVLKDQAVRHVYWLTDSRVTRMQIEAG